MFPEISGCHISDVERTADEAKSPMRELGMTLFVIVVKFRPHAGVAKW